MKIKKAVFPAAGFGTRFLPATKAIPKEMLPLIDKPLIQYSVEEANNSGLDEIIIITGMGKTAIEDHFDISFELESLLKEKGKTDILKMIDDISSLIHFSYTRQKKPLGLGHAVLCAKNLVNREPFAVFLSDDVIDSRVPVMKQMLSVFDKYPATILAVQRVPEKDVHKYGIIKAEKVKDRIYRVFDMIEKPHPKDAPSNLAIIGRYILSPEIFEALENTHHGAGGEIQLTDGLRQIVKEQDVYALEFEGTRYDAGDKVGFLMANVSYALKREDIKDEFKRFLKGLKI
ncbi:MAG: UTP--glucose-1-phosphate uridylyltransferase GalU [Deltaproteobacteria bacterium]|nr:UTP--glucose-1-phosphate uridylyltransferase GalU [Deltaproteobacteria bacterium]